ncbi:liver-expressed antimicrobial peptide 2 [Betta splendens]|uniref:Liver-expressed antimicrobial peptide 2 n=1 Tax=Betta splendens TaxID=158456 RepID=A0A6P7LJF3_BETSP|nr:liver-expressed antimicrobial peptide 2 [Betta splendens]
MQKNTTAILCFVLLVLTQQVCAGPLGSQLSSPEQSPRSRGGDRVQTLRRAARMTPLWRIMNSKPLGAFCQNNYECTTGICRAGHCSTSHHSSSEAAKY